MTPDFKERTAMLKDKMAEVDATLDREGYQLRAQRAEFSVSRSSLVINYDNGNQREIPDHELKEILDGNRQVPESDKTLIGEWYDISSYRFGHEYEKLEQEKKEAKQQKDKARIKEIESRMQELTTEYKSLSPAEREKQQLAYYYGEEEERLDRLQQLLDEPFGGTGETVLRFGLFDVSVNANSYTEDISQSSYEASKGFFTDLENAFRFVSELRGPTEYSESTGIAYSNETVFGRGLGRLNVNKKPVNLEGRVEKEGFKDSLSCSVKATDLELDTEKLMQRVSLYLPDYLLERSSHSDSIMGTNETVVVLYNSLGLMFVGQPQSLRTEVPRFLETILE
jgi:hypothetical protein